MRTSAFGCAALVGLLLFGCGEAIDHSESESLVLSDVTFLVPLGGANDFGASTTGGYGALLPLARFESVEALTRSDEPEALYENLDVVAVRLDPCFFEGTGEVTCSSQVRLVMQPVFDEEGTPISRDATVHAFYQVPVLELRALASSLADLRVDLSGSEAIGEHASPNAAAALVLPYIGQERLIRVTFVTVHASNQAWTFGGFDIIDGVNDHIQPPGVDEHEQHLTSVGGTEMLDATILPVPVIETEAALWLSAIDRAEMDVDVEDAAIAGFERLLNPAEHNPGTVDCASCHMATTGLYFADQQRGGGAVPAVYANSQNQRMLGYFLREPSISPRVQAETRGVLEALEPW
jgi:hypothetical protein